LRCTLVSFLTILVLTSDAASQAPVGAFASAADSGWRVSVPTAGNSWVVNMPDDSAISGSGITNWSNSASLIRTFFRVDQPGKIRIGIRARVSEGRSKLGVAYGGSTREIELSNTSFEVIPVGVFAVDGPGYQRFDMQGVTRSSSAFAEVTDILIGGPAAGKVHFVRDDFYWGRRGPSVHLRYNLPSGADSIEWFYSEVSIPEGEDVVGSYFMTNGFAEGYCGIQVNSPTERRILFSVWSPYPTDNPEEIPVDSRVQLMKKGGQVKAGNFGDEGSGGQSYRIYNWKAGVTYRVLLRGRPSDNNSTDYTAYFYSPEIGTWEFIAQFRRPKTRTYLKNLYAFLENFLPETGHISRRGLFSNQWVRSAAGNWYELTRATVTADATARKGARLDYAGGVEGGSFFLKNCGFFNGPSEPGAPLVRRMTGTVPDVDLSRLE